jgi:uncharacterized protein
VSYLVIHGWQNHRPEVHWQRWLVQRLRAAGEQVVYPQLPDPDEPELGAWLTVLRDELEMLRGGERTVIAHSLGCLLWLQHAQTAPRPEPVDRLLLVCPPGPAALPDRLAPFYRPLDDPDAVARSVRSEPELVCTDADPWCPEGAADLYGGPLRLQTHCIAGAGHLSMDEGYGPWPAVEDWALQGSLDAVSLQT